MVRSVLKIPPGVRRLEAILKETGPVIRDEAVDLYNIKHKKQSIGKNSAQQYLAKFVRQFTKIGQTRIKYKIKGVCRSYLVMVCASNEWLKKNKNKYEDFEDLVEKYDKGDFKHLLRRYKNRYKIKIS